MQARLQFAERYEDRAEEEWKKTVFLNEKVYSTHKDGRYGVWRPDGTRYDHPYVLPTTYSGRHTKAYWAWVSGYGPGEIVEVGRRMNAQHYVNILENVLLPSAIEKFPDEDIIFIIEDNSAVHTARVVQQWYNAHPRLNRLIWPAR